MSRPVVVMTAPSLAAAAVALLEAAGCDIHYMPAYPSAQAVVDAVRATQATAVLTRQGPVGSAAMDASQRLRIVARHGVGVDDVDLAAAAVRGILVTRSAGSNTRAVAEHTLAMLFALAKGFRPLGACIAAGEWRGASTTVRDLDGLRLGLVGYGGIARAVADFAAPFGIVVTAFDPAAPSGMFVGAARSVGLVELLAGSDAVSVHCPFTPATRHLIDARALASLPAGAFVINTARGGIVDEAALLAAIETGHIAGAALDVFETEPPPVGYALRSHPSVIVTPHVAGVTDSALVAMGVMAAECIVAVLTGGTVPPDRIVHP